MGAGTGLLGRAAALAMAGLVATSFALEPPEVKDGFSLHPPGGNGTGAVAIAFGDGRAWVSNSTTDTVTVLDEGGLVEWSVDVGDAPHGLAVDEANSELYVANFGDDTVTVVDTGDLTIFVPVISVGDGPIEVAVNQTTDRVYVANQGTDGTPGTTVTVIQAGTQEVLDTVTVGNYPDTLTIDEVSNQIYVAKLYESTIDVIDGATHAVTSFETGLSDRIRDIAIDRANDRMYLCDRGFDRVGVYVYSTRALIQTVAVGYLPKAFELDLVDGLLYVLTNGAVDVIDLDVPEVAETLLVGTTIDPRGLVSVQSWGRLLTANANATVHSYYLSSLSLWYRALLAIAPNAVAANAATGRVFAATWNAGEPEASVWALAASPPGYKVRVPVAPAPVDLAVDATRNRIYVGHDANETPTLTVIDGATNQVADTIVAYSDRVAVNPVTNRIHAIRGGANAYAVIDGDGIASTYFVDLPWPNIVDVAVDATLNRLYVSSTWDGGSIAVLDATTNVLVTELDVGAGELAVDAAHQRLYVGDVLHDQVHVVDTATNGVLASVAVPVPPRQIAVDPVTRWVLVGSWESEELRLIDGRTNLLSDRTVTVGPTVADLATDGVHEGAYAAMAAEGLVHVIHRGLIFEDGFEGASVCTWSTATGAPPCT